ncbi:MAG: DNA polymerase III subunit alpha [Bacteroides sp.]|nr:DNA polymerase III subunit alpha [Bacteroides sp.]
MPYFTHLHLHTLYSVLDGACKIPDLMNKAKEFGMDAMAITDHGNMYGVMEFVNKARGAGIKPIVGCEVYVAPNSRFEKRGKDEDRTNYHLILLAKNPTGYHNLVKLCSLSQRKEAFYYKPRIDHDLLRQYHEGLVCCSACLAGEVPQAILSGQEEQLKEHIAFFKGLFGEDYYFEMQRHGHEEQMIVNARLEQLAAEYNIKCIATNDVHFVNADDYEAHRILICLNTGKKLHEDTKMLYTGQEYFKSADEMAELFPDHPEYLENTREIVEKIESFELEHAPLMPHFPLPEPFTEDMEYLRHLTYEGAKKRYGENFRENEVLRERLDFELDTIAGMGFPGYFLIVWDFIRAAREMGVLVGPGRGSAAGSMLAYCLGITNIDPVKYDLLFERFLNPERISLPDIDVDFDDAGRGRVIDYVKEKYGSERVSQIITYGTMAAKSAIKDVARVLDLPLPESNRLAKLVPDNPGMTLPKAFKEVPDLQKEMDGNPDPLVRDTLRYAIKLEGCIRSVGVHACGMIIAPEDIIEYVPTGVAKDSEMPVTQYEGTYVESVGLIKMDFLGLKTLTIIKGALDNIKLRHGIDIDIESIPLDDKATYELFGNGETNGIFQFESPGMQKYLKELKPTRLEDIIAMNALYRPGPMEYIPQFIRRKEGKEAIDYDLPEMEEYLHDTYGITVYQEQVMLLSQKLAGFSKGDADKLRKAMGKKKKDVLDQMKAKFMDGCGGHQLNPEVCEKVWKDWEAFASYAFNKSHATCYAWIAYQTAYLKAHYPAEYMASVLTSNLSAIDKISFFMDECKHMGIQLLSPDVNESMGFFTVNKDGAIRFGLSGIKNVGTNVVEELIKEREENGPFKDVLDFVTRVNLRSMNRRCMEALVMAGAFDSFGLTRSVFFFQRPGENQTFTEKLLQYGASVQRNQSSTQTDLFGNSMEEVASTIDIPNVEPWSQIEQLSNEKEVVGIYLSGFPLDPYRLELKTFSNINISGIKSRPIGDFRGKILHFGGIVTASSLNLKTKTGKDYGRFTLADYDDSMEFMLFGNDYINFKNFVDVVGRLVFITADVRQRWAKEKDAAPEYELRIQAMELLDEMLDKKAKKLRLTLRSKDVTPEFTEKVQRVCRNNALNKKLAQSGGAVVDFHVVDSINALSVSMILPAKVKPSDFLADLKKENLEPEVKID